MSAPPRPEWLFTDAAAVLIQAKPLQQARAYIEHLEARIDWLLERLDAAVDAGVERMAEQAELEREARD